VGLTAESSAAAVRAQVSRVEQHPYMIDAAGEKLCGARDRSVDPDVWGAPRLLALLRPALLEMATKLTRNGPQRLLRVILALPEQRPGHSADDSRSLLAALARETLPEIERLTIECVGMGHAGAFVALERAVAVTSADDDTVAVAGGLDSYFHPDTVDWLEERHRLARAEEPSGFPPGEGVALVALTNRGVCRRSGFRPLAHVRGVATGREPRTPDSDEGVMGEVLSRVLARASADSVGGARERLDGIFCDINGERWRTDDWGFAALRLPQLFHDPTSYVSAVGQWGDVGAATGALGCVLAVQSWQRCYAAGPRALVWGASWDGQRGAVVLTQAEA
jgi:3-oxoacyl-[acyl-carrier-protein] synthase-1